MTNLESCLFSAAIATVKEEVDQLYQKDRIPMKDHKKMAQDVVKNYKIMQSIMKINTERRNLGKPKERIDVFKESLKKTMPIKPKNVL